MPIFHARVPNFLFTLFLRAMPQLRNDPVALIGPDERVWSASPAAKDDGVELGLTAHQARMRCADCRVHELNLAQIEDADAVFLGVLELELSSQPVALPELSEFEAATWEYELMGMSTAGQFLQHYQPTLALKGAMTTAQVKLQPAGRHVRLAGMIVVKQRPQTAKGILFLSFEDELGLVDVVMKSDEVRCFKAILREHLLIVEGVVQRSGEVVSVLAHTVRQLTI